MTGGGPGRGRGEPPKKQGFDQPRGQGPSRPGGSGSGPVPIFDSGDANSSSSDSGEGERTIRGRGGLRQSRPELHTIPANITQVRAQGNEPGTSIKVFANFVKVSPIGKKAVYMYRIDFEPQVDSLLFRRRAFYQATSNLFPTKATYDGYSDARSSDKTEQEVNLLEVDHPTQEGTKIKIKIKRVGQIQWGSFEMIRLYNIQMKGFLRALGFYQVSRTGSYVHPELHTKIDSQHLMIVRGYNTSVQVHEEDVILVNLESVHKIINQFNVLQTLNSLMNQHNRNFESVKAALIGKLVVTKYNKRVYRIEDVVRNISPQSTFRDEKNNRDISYIQYYRDRYNENISVGAQPMLLVIPNNKRRADRGAGDPEDKDIYLVPELCNIAGLTDDQRNDNQLKMELIRQTQMAPALRVEYIKKFLEKLHNNEEVRSTLNQWGYTYGNEPVALSARIMPPERIAVGRNAGSKESFQPVDQMGGFDRAVTSQQMAVCPQFNRMVILIGKFDLNMEDTITNKLKAGFSRVGLAPRDVEIVKMPNGDQATDYVRHLRQVSANTTATVVILSRQNKERYNAVKKTASIERGLVTQVVTSKLMRDERRGQSAAVKIGIQIAAKIGGEPWFIQLPIPNAMICGYDTYHDTSKQGRSFGAFVASTNSRFSRWFSKADCHDRIDELSSHLAQNLGEALKKYRSVNERFPERVIIYRDGVGDGQLDHVFNIECKELQKVIGEIEPSIKLTVIVVNKRIGARFYMVQGTSYANCPPGTVIDNVVTRKSRYDFYLVSQSTRQGTVAPTYYNILHDESGLSPSRHQMMAYKLCLLYYNWTGTVRVPAPCQYAHKLAYLCGEHLHGTPNASLDDRLHFL